MYIIAEMYGCNECTYTYIRKFKTNAGLNSTSDMFFSLQLTIMIGVAKSIV